jgi:hypothetical protein
MAKQVASQRSTEAPASTSRKRAGNKAPAAESSTASQPPVVRQEPSYEQIAERAYGLYLARGAHEGDAFDDWVRAENELRASH